MPRAVRRPTSVSTLGRIGIVAGITGALSAAVMLAWRIHSPPGIVRYPFSPTEPHAIQTWFFVHHLGLAAAVVGLARSGAVGGGRIARDGAWLAVIGTALLAPMELVTATYFGEANMSLLADAVLWAGTR